MIINIENKIKPALNLNSLSSSIDKVTNTSASSNRSNANDNHNNNIQRTSNNVKLNLQKGQKTSLSKLSSNIDNIEIELGWQANSWLDVNAEAFLLNAQEKIISDEWFVFYNQEISPDKSVKLQVRSSQNKEKFDISLSKVNPVINKIVFVLTIDEALEKNQNFSQISNAYIEVKDCKTNTKLIRFDLTEYYSQVISMMVGEIYKKNNEWRFNPVGNGIGDDLLGLCNFYGVEVRE